MSLWLSCVAALLLRQTEPLTDDFDLSWAVGNASLDVTLSWKGHDWAALGFHQEPGQGMPGAEIYMCHKEGHCQVRLSSGYSLPPVDTSRTVPVVSATTVDGQTRVRFTRPLAKQGDSSVAITNSTLGLIYAAGMWTGPPMPAGAPLQHTAAGRLSLNFFAPAPPTPAPTPATPKAGVWPASFDANMTIAMAQMPEQGQLTVNFWARLRYDFGAKPPSQHWEYYELDPVDQVRKSLGGELWVGTMLYQLGPDGSCSGSDMGFGIIRPDWLQSTSFVTANFLLRQPKDGEHWSNYTFSELYQVPNTLGMTNSWLVAGSKIAEPVRLEGPDAFDHPAWRSILEYGSFKPQPVDASVFAVPAACSSGLLGAPRRAWPRPAQFLEAIARSQDRVVV